MNTIPTTRHLEYYITQQDIKLLSETYKTVFIKLELLNHSMQVINSLEGNLISDSISNNADSKVRRTYDCTFFVSDHQWMIGADTNFWIDKYVRPYIGYQSNLHNEPVWYKLGTFVMDSPTIAFDESNHTISLSCLDLMCTLDGTRGGYIGGDQMGGLTHLVEQGSNIREALIAILEEAGVTEYDICAFNHEIPYDIEVNVGSTYADFLETIIGLYAGYEYFFDLNGVFVVQLIPQLKSDPVILTAEIINPLVISENTSYDWSAIKNYVEVYGQTIEADFYCDEVAGTINNWVATIDTVTSYEEGDTYALKVPTSNSGNLKININNLGAKRVYDDDGNYLAANMVSPNEVYCFRYRRSSDSMVFLGQYQVYGYYAETSETCPFSTTNLGYTIGAVITDDAIYSDSLAKQRAKYEVYLASWMKDSISLTMINIPFLCVNQKIGYTNSQGVSDEYIVKSIQRDNSTNTMTVSMVKFTEAYPDMDSVYQYTYGEGDLE